MCDHRCALHVSPPLTLANAETQPEPLGENVTPLDVSRCDPFPRTGDAAAHLTRALLVAAAHSFERVRAASTETLKLLHTPAHTKPTSTWPNAVAGLQTEADAMMWMSWAVRLVRSPRVRDADAGARVIRLLADLLGTSRGWTVTLCPTVRATPPEGKKRLS